MENILSTSGEYSSQSRFLNKEQKDQQLLQQQVAALWLLLDLSSTIFSTHPRYHLIKINMD